MYCDSCPNVLLLKNHKIFEDREIKFPNLLPSDEGWQSYEKHLLPIYSKVESLFKPCDCGGHFRAWANPRCPVCNDFLLGEETEPDKPSKWVSRSSYVFIATNSYDDEQYLVGNGA
jgi:hypothetical protein